MSSWYESDIITNGIRIHYYRTGGPEGNNKPQVVLCHGLGDSALCWTQFARELEADYDCILVDARCHGQSEAPRQGNGAQAMGADLAGLIRGLGLQQPVCMGHSMGAAYVPYAAAMAAAIADELIRAIILEDPPWRDSDALVSRDSPISLNVTAWRADFARIQAMSWDELEAKTRRDAPDLDQDTLRAVIQAKYDLDQRALCPDLIGSDPWRVVLGRIGCPVLLLTGETARGGIVTETLAQEAQVIHSHLEHVHVADVGHLLHYNQLERTVSVVKAYLASI